MVKVIISELPPWLKGKFELLGPALRWLSPGLGVKRWLVVMLVGITFLSLGLGIFILDLYRNASDTWWLPFLSFASLRILDRPIRVIVFAALGLGIVAWGTWGLNKALLKPFLKPGHLVVDSLYSHRRKEKGPRIVVIGGGHGISMLLRGLKIFTHNLTAVVTVADDGGSSGRLRKSMGILPPGDLRNCLAALSNDEDLMTQLFQYRFSNGDGELDGHSFGNLFISALSEITGSFENAVAESGRVLSVYGRVLPSTLHDVRLVADVIPPYDSQQIRISGESQIPLVGGKVKRIWLDPGSPPAYPEVIRSLLAADLIVIGPGSLYTSILPNLLVPDITAALKASRALKIFVCNVATQAGETDNFTSWDHIQAIEEHIGSEIFDVIVANNHYQGALLDGMQWVEVDEELGINYEVYNTDMIDESQPWHHDSKKISKALMDLLIGKSQRLVE